MEAIGRVEAACTSDALRDGEVWLQAALAQSRPGPATLRTIPERVTDGPPPRGLASRRHPCRGPVRGPGRANASQ
ncbi:hypothetical protein Afil01_29610 [Actinorhabdospora filicis]|uniref:Uncharacterized protein n=1 Tax=Actinorhabdospora filicis TaxID=1785913 RepID=A0A9W6W930_9ACTN|nr:hypothetical protein Afil01_29610 [Actinorhabdospora filicis]